MRLAGALRACDEETLAALASPGLVKRARKDLEKAGPPALRVEGEEMVVEVEGLEVRLRAPLERSTCPCPASGFCRHLLAAILHAREAAPGDAGAPSAAEELKALEVAAIRTWAPAALRRKAARLLAEEGAPEFEEGAVLVARFPMAECRFLPGSGLAGGVCSCEARGACVHRVAAVLALRGEGGVPAEEPAPAPAGAPRTREEVLESLGVLLRQVVAGGLCRLSPATSERLATLAAAAHGTDVPRLERALRALAGEVEAYRFRQGGASAGRVLSLAARAEGLRHALVRRPTPERLGRHREEYRAMGELELIGMGARQWRTPSGFQGLTVYFRGGGRWLTWSEVRPPGQGFDPVAAWRAPGPWAGSPSPARAAAARLRLRGGWRTSSGRLSGRPSSRALLLGDASPLQEVQPARRWEALRPVEAGGLVPPEEVETLQVVEPASWGEAAFDPSLQELHRVVRDAEGEPLLLRLPWAGSTERAVRHLEACQPPGGTAVLGRLHRWQGWLALEPWVLYAPEGTLSLTLDLEEVSAPPPAAGAPAAEGDPDWDDDEAPGAAGSSPLGRLLAEGSAALTEAAEAGPAAFPPGRLERLAGELGAVGLEAPAGLLRDLAARLRSPEADPEDLGRRVLRAAYVVQLAARLEEGSPPGL